MSHVGAGLNPAPTLMINYLYDRHLVSVQLGADGRAVLIPISNYKTIFVILSAAKNLYLITAEILHEAQLRSE